MAGEKVNWSYVVKRLLLLIPTLFGITLITFFVMKLAPGDPVKLKLMFAENIDPRALAAVLKSAKPAVKLPPWMENFVYEASRKVHGDLAKPELRDKSAAYNSIPWPVHLKNRKESLFYCDFARQALSGDGTYQPPSWYVHLAGHGRPAWRCARASPDLIRKTATYKTLHWAGENSVFYFKWLGNVLTLDFGLSSKDKKPVTTKIVEALPFTLTLNVITIIIVYLVSVPLGMWSALRKDSWLDKAVMVELFLLYSIPGFWLATMLLIFFAGGEYLNLFPFGGFYSDNFEQLGFFAKIGDVAYHLFLPVVAETIGSFAFLARFSRSNFLEVIRQDYIRTARAKGLPEKKVLYKHVLRNSLIPFVTMMGTLLPALIGGSVVVEKIFSIPGMGLLSFEAVDGRDQNVIMGLATIGAFLTLVGLMISDLLYRMVDPRIKLE